MFLIGMFIAMFVVVFICVAYEQKRVYKDEDLVLRRVENPEDNSYHFETSLLSFQYKKYAELKKRYGQNSIIYCEKDSSHHKVLRWGANVRGIQRIIAEPYIVDEVFREGGYTIYVSNYGSIYIDLCNISGFDELYSAVLNSDGIYNEQEKNDVVDILNDLSNNKVVTKNSLKRLCEFFEKYESLFSFSANALSIISAIAGLI